MATNVWWTLEADLRRGARNVCAGELTRGSLSSPEMLMRNARQSDK